YAAVKIFEVEGKPPLTGLFSGILHISQVSTSFVRTLYDVVRIGDIIRAQVLNRAPLYQISIRGREFGVVYALCSECLTPLVLRSLQLFCPKCRRVEKRKVAFSYYMVRRSSA
ncbi:MAG: RNA-binding protein, partial [Thermoprotei archaeon]